MDVATSGRALRALGVRPGEGRLILVVAATFAAIEAARGIGEIGVDTLVVSRFGTGMLPALFVALGLVSLGVAVAYGAALGRLRRAPLLVGLLTGTGVLIVALRLLLPVAEATVVPVLWLAVYAAGAVAATVSWTVAGSVLDVRQAKRLFPLCTSAAIAGGFAGTLTAGPLARIAGTETLVLVEAALLAAAAALIARVASMPAGVRLRAAATGAIGPDTGRRRHGATAEPPSVVRALRAGFDEVVRSPLLRLIAVAYLVFAVLQFSVTFPFLQAMDEATGSEAELATALGFLSAGVTAASLVVSLVLAPRLFARFGVGTVALILPVVYLVGFGLWLVQFTVVTAAALRFAQQVTQRGVSNAAWSAFYNSVPSGRRAQVLAFMDGVPGQLGIALSGVLLLGAAAMARSQVFWLGLAAAVVCTAVVLGIRGRYGESLLRTLRGGMGERLLEGGPGLAGLGGREVTAALLDGLDAPDPAVRRMAAELLGRLAGSPAASGLADHVDDADPSVRAAVIEALGAIGSSTPAVAAAVARFDDPSPAVRAAAVHATAALDPAAIDARADDLARDPAPAVRAALAVALVRAGREELPHALLAALLEAPGADERIAGLQAVGMLGGHSPSARIPDYLADPVPAVRAAAVRALAAMDGAEAIVEPFVKALDDDARQVRRTAAAVLSARPEPPDGVLRVLATGSPRAQDAALRALEGHGPAVRTALLDWSAAKVDRATDLRRQRLALEAADGSVVAGGPDTPGAFLAFLLQRREEDIEARLLHALAVLGAPEASGLIRRCLRSNDADTRAQAVEALDSIGDGSIRRGIVALLDDAPAGIGHQGETVLQALAADPDPWIRALALRTRAERAAAVLAGLRAQATTDPDIVVRTALGAALGGASEEDDMETKSAHAAGRTIDGIDRMLFLRRVPLFRELEPEDLQRIATAAVEARYAPGEALVEEGQIGNEMVIIVEGTVSVERVEADGTRRHLTRYGPGDHIGELAMLRERPRAATVVAEEPGVRGLLIDGEGLMAMLRERPEAAMAMLATLAERIGSQ